ncbi:MAG: hypothetical protein CVU38_20645 [Chloroflexi bacterium HGW-Chloroflexi-1]|nr:MAG: hypothetical protein CVU38_20645 [Chloroflexi bacterium HGW-Chloroflexi-1]
MKILVDVGVSKMVEEWLARQRFDVKAVRDLNPSMADFDILALAVTEERLVITMDKDFGEMIVRSGLPHAGVLLLRLEDATSAEKVVVVQHIFASYLDVLPGHYCVYQRGRLRVRGLPGSAN